MQPLFVNAYTAVSAVGAGRADTCDALREMRPGLAPNDFAHAPSGGFIGRVAGLEAVRLPADLAEYDCRNHRLAWLALGQDGFADAVAAARTRHGAARVATIVGTSTSGILETELAYRARDPATGALPATVRYATAHNFAALAGFVRQACALRGPMLAISTACSSSAKVFATAARWLAAGLCDAAVVAGVDSLCGTTLHGFGALQLVSSAPCRPFDAARDGLSLGEAAGLALLERTPGRAHRVALVGYGESVDAYHMSAPHPEGRGAALAMAAALGRCGRRGSDIDCVQAHGTATRNNDAVEARAIARVIGADVPVTSIKGHLGHTLGAAGILGAVAAALSIEHGFVPGTANTTSVDPACGRAVQLATRERPVAAVLVNALGFGGNNASLVFARMP